MTSTGQSRAETRLRPPDPLWHLADAPDPIQVADLATALGLPAAVCAILIRRGYNEVERAKFFLRPRLERLHDPALLADGPLAARRIARSVRDRETVFVHGDYDVDGICATALLTRWLRTLGAEVVPFVPHRTRDGYDFSAAGLAAAVDCDARLIITADCGSLAHDTVAAATEAGIDVIVTDHHTVSDVLPDAHAVVNPQRPDCSYPDKRLCGAGVAYKVCELIGKELGVEGEPLLALLDLVALATVADLVPLEGENRVLVHFGLRRFADSHVLGIRALFAAGAVDPNTVTSGQLGFVIAPRINAAGRVGESADALRLLLTESATEAEALAGELEEINGLRREEDSRTLDEALDLLAGEFDPARDFGVVIAGQGWHPGVIGIVASRVVERIHRPVVMIALTEEGGRGSARSIPGFHLHEALSECASHLERFGGHRQAAGMDIQAEAVPAFRASFNDAARARLSGQDLRPVLRPDLDIRLSDVDLQLIHWLGYLGPHGMGNAGPLFAARDVELHGARVVGSNHLKVTLAQGGARLDAIGFGFADRFDVGELNGAGYDALFRLERNEWRGRALPQAKLVDLRRSGAEA